MPCCQALEDVFKTAVQHNIQSAMHQYSFKPPTSTLCPYLPLSVCTCMCMHVCTHEVCAALSNLELLADSPTQDASGGKLELSTPFSATPCHTHLQGKMQVGQAAFLAPASERCRRRHWVTDGTCSVCEPVPRPQFLPSNPWSTVC